MGGLVVLSKSEEEGARPGEGESERESPFPPGLVQLVRTLFP